MLRYVLRLLVEIPFMLIVVSIVLFLLVNVSRVDPAAMLLDANATEEQVQQLHEELGLDQPLIIQYFNYIKNALHGDFGYSYYSKRDVIDEIGSRIPTTLKLAVITIAFAIVVGVPFGILCAEKQYTPVDTIITTCAMCLTGTPVFWLGLMLQLVFCLKLGWFPAQGLSGITSWILPVFTLSLPYMSNFIRNTRAAMLDNIRQDYVRTARSKGVGEFWITYKHALCNALLPLITMTGTMIASLLTGALVIENVFAIPGLGLLIINSIKNKDIPVVMTGVLFIAIFYLLIMIVIDVLYALVDPRIRANYTRGNSKKSLQKSQQAADSSG